MVFRGFCDNPSYPFASGLYRRFGGAVNLFGEVDAMEVLDPNLWKKCSSCKKPIAFLAKYYVCSVSTCNGQRTGYVFCSVPCFEVHLPSARHKDAAAIEMRAPSKADAQREPTRKIITSPASTNTTPAANSKTPIPKDVLIIASRLKDYIQARADMNTSANVMDVLSDHIRVIADRAIDQARAEGRKTVMDRDLSFLKNLK